MEKVYSQLLIFFYVAHFMSFTKTAKHLNCSKAYISKQMNELERVIGTSLFHRSTRKIQLTLAGESMFEHAELIVREVQYAENTIASLQNKAQGLLRITAPSAYADNILAPNLPEFLHKYPEITVDINSTGQLLNLVDQKIDIAIRLTHEPPLDRVAKRIGEYRMVICASKRYIQEKGEPKSPKQLIDHDCLVYSTEKNYRYWSFLIEEQALSVEVEPKLSANNSIVLLKAALGGLGIVRLPNYVVQDAINNQELQLILTNFYPNPIPIYAIYAQSRIIPPKIHVFLKFMREILHTV